MILSDIHYFMMVIIKTLRLLGTTTCFNGWQSSKHCLARFEIVSFVFPSTAKENAVIIPQFLVAAYF